MKKTNLKVAALMIFGAIFIGCNDQDTLNSPSDENAIDNESKVINNQYIITLKKGTLSQPSSRGSKRAYNSSMETLKSEVSNKFQTLKIENDNIKATFGYALEGFVAKLTKAQIEELKNDPRVKRIEEDYMITLAPKKGKPGGGGGGSTPQETPWGITRVGGAASGVGKTAWIIDSGIDLDHPDLNVDSGRSRTFVTSGKDARSADDGNGHGSHVAGTVGALDNSTGVVGVAPGANLVALKVLDSRGSGQFSWTVQALDYVAANGSAGDAVNMSLGPRSRYTDSAVDQATLNVASLGINIAIAAGNSDDDCSFYSPARVNHPNVYTVSNMTINEVLASSSNYGDPVDYAAPGTSIKSTWKGGGYNTISGTSMASPHVCGLLLTGGVTGDGFVQQDKDNNPDPIAVRN
ncbi:S8 family serine peptidase [Tenacibaculum xiamenense]|uniref:S8 family serine peptidase n=1 Tax=Tenacibaculum xiamenense TaxID=1261553 RepID=UPI0038B4E07E